jgi:hypothetical protein
MDLKKLISELLLEIDNKLRSGLLTKQQMIGLGATGALDKAFERYIPIQKIHGLDPTPSDWTDDEGNVRKYKKGEPITKSIEVVYDVNNDIYLLQNGNHRIKQAKLNGDKYIRAFIQPSKGRIGDDIKYNINENAISNHELPQYWYHGTNKHFNKFTLENMGKNWKQSVLGVYFSQYIKPGIYGSTAKEYAEDLVVREGGKPYIYKCEIQTKKPLILDSNGWYSSNTYIDKNRNDIKSKMNADGNDCVISYDFENKENEGLQWGDYILATNNLDIIKIIDIFEFK